MPLYEYSCRSCHEEFELLVRGDDRPACPHCSSMKLEKLLSAVAAPATGGRDLPQCHPMPSGGCGLPQCGSGGCMMG